MELVQRNAAERVRLGKLAIPECSASGSGREGLASAMRRVVHRDLSPRTDSGRWDRQDLDFRLAKPCRRTSRAVGGERRDVAPSPAPTRTRPRRPGLGPVGTWRPTGARAAVDARGRLLRACCVLYELLPGAAVQPITDRTRNAILKQPMRRALEADAPASSSAPAQGLARSRRRYQTRATWRRLASVATRVDSAPRPRAASSSDAARGYRRLDATCGRPPWDAAPSRRVGSRVGFRCSSAAYGAMP